MRVQGALSCMALEDLLQWMAQARKTGRLHVERDSISRRIWVRDGRVVACSSNDPPTLLGQFLLARGWIGSEVLAEALGRQEETRENLGTILRDMGAISDDVLNRYLASKAEESIFGLFEWSDALFEFELGCQPDAAVVPVDLDVQDVLLQGAQRREDTRRIRAVLPHDEIVLERTEDHPPEAYLASPLARSIYDLIDGRRSLAEILLHTHGSQFVALRFLAELHGIGSVRIVETEGRESAPEPETPDCAPESIAGLVSQGEIDEALEKLDRACRSAPADASLSELRSRAEAAFLESVEEEELPADAVPVLVARPDEEMRRQLSPTHVYLLDLLSSGHWTVKSLLWIAPKRRVEVLRALKRLRADGWVCLQESGRPSKAAV